MAHALTGLRLLLAAPVALGLARPESFPPSWLLGCIVVAIATDFLDGIVARKTDAASPRGRLFDHTTDFLFVTAGLGGAALSGEVSAVLPPLIVVAFSQYVVDSYWLHREKQLRMSALGRWNGMLYFVPLVVIAVARLDVMPGSRDLWATLILWMSHGLLLSTVVSIIDRAIAPRGARPSLAEPPRLEEP